MKETLELMIERIIYECHNKTPGAMAGIIADAVMDWNMEQDDDNRMMSFDEFASMVVEGDIFEFYAADAFDFRNLQVQLMQGTRLKVFYNLKNENGERLIGFNTEDAEEVFWCFYGSVPAAQRSTFRILQRAAR